MYQSLGVSCPRRPLPMMATHEQIRLARALLKPPTHELLDGEMTGGQQSTPPKSGQEGTPPKSGQKPGPSQKQQVPRTPEQLAEHAAWNEDESLPSQRPDFVKTSKFNSVCSALIFSMRTCIPLHVPSLPVFFRWM